MDNIDCALVLRLLINLYFTHKLDSIISCDIYMLGHDINVSLDNQENFTSDANTYADWKCILLAQYLTNQ